VTPGIAPTVAIMARIPIPGFGVRGPRVTPSSPELSGMRGVNGRTQIGSGEGAERVLLTVNYRKVVGNDIRQTD